MKTLHRVREETVHECMKLRIMQISMKVSDKERDEQRTKEVGIGENEHGEGNPSVKGIQRRRERGDKRSGRRHSTTRRRS